MKKILILSTRLPYPLIDGVRVRIYHTAKHLSEKFSVDLFCVSPNEPEPGAVEALRQVFNSIRVVRINPIVSGLRAAMSVFSGLPLQVHYFYRRRIQAMITPLLDQYDIILCNHIRMTEYVQTHASKTIVDLHDSLAMHYERALDIVGIQQRFIFKYEFPRVLSYERKVVETFARSIVVSDVDREYLIGKGAPERNIETINVAVRDDIAVNSIPADRKFISFLGKMSYHPNIDAVEWFVRRVFPSIREKHEDVYFYIIGATPSRRVRRLGEEKNVVVTGFVENPFELVEQSLFMVAPIRIGAGLQNKVLEAMSIGKAVITTSLGAEGIGGIDGEHFMIANTAEESIANIEVLLAEPELCRGIGVNARNLIDERYRWNSAGDAFKYLAASLLR